MDDPIRREMGFYHPRVTNHIENDPTPKDQAIYVPSVIPPGISGVQK